MTAEEFRLLRELINAHSGMNFGDDDLGFLERRLAARVSVLGLRNYYEYYHHLRYHPTKASELVSMMDSVTTNETYFFREVRQLQAFRDQILPELRRAAQVRKALTIWSAGCSSGEEAYTLAILIDESDLFEGWDVRVFGNDISQRVVNLARAGMFRESSFKATPVEYRHYFVESSTGRCPIPRIRAMCSFGHFNLLDERQTLMVGHVDVIVCRNVLIYLDQKSRQRLVQIFHDRLHPGGYLLLGHSESLLYAPTTFDFAHLRGDLAYRKGDVARFGAGRRTQR